MSRLRELLENSDEKVFTAEFPTIDGGGITAPSLAFFNLEGKWDVENIGISPTFEVENTPIENGKDAQLERAVAEAMKLLQTEPVKRLPRPAPIDRVSKP